MRSALYAGVSTKDQSCVTAVDVIEFRAAWTWKSGLTKQKAQQIFDHSCVWRAEKICAISWTY